MGVQKLGKYVHSKTHCHFKTCLLIRNIVIECAKRYVRNEMQDAYVRIFKAPVLCSF